MEEIYIGTSGYDYPEWKGSFYPTELKRENFLSYYAAKFNALELNSSFYSMPVPERMKKLAERSEEKIKFSIKANNLLTHNINRNWKTAAEEFISAANVLSEKDLLEAVLFQFPQSFHYTAENRFYLSDVMKEFSSLPVVIEFRHKEWIRESVFSGIILRGGSVAFCDMPQLKNLPVTDFSQQVRTQFIGKTAYIRLHGRNAGMWYAASSENGNNGSARYDYEYSDEELLKFVPVIKTSSIEGRKVMVFFNNHPEGKGARNAQRLKELVEGQ